MGPALHLERVALVVNLLLVRLEHVVRAHLVRVRGEG